MATAPTPGAVATAVPCPDDGSGLWTELLALLWLTAHASQRPDTRRRLRAQGVRRPETLGQHLGEEWRQALRRAEACGALPAPRTLFLRVGQLAQPRPWPDALALLVQAYAALARHPRVGRDPALAAWVQGRAQVHGAQLGGARDGEGPPA
jgi:hypothetical protein